MCVKAIIYHEDEQMELSVIPMQQEGGVHISSSAQSSGTTSFLPTFDSVRGHLWTSNVALPLGAGADSSVGHLCSV